MRHQAEARTCQQLRAENVAAGSTRLSTDEWQSSRGSPLSPATVRHSVREWARDDAGDGHRLLARNREGHLDDTDHAMLDALMQMYRRGLVRKAQAWKVAVARGLRGTLT